jgi:hypothetical protein
MDMIASPKFHRALGANSLTDGYGKHHILTSEIKRSEGILSFINTTWTGDQGNFQ